VLDVPLPFRERQVVLKELAERYRKATKGDKSRLLDEAEKLLHLNRNYLSRALRLARRNRKPAGLVRLHSRGRPPKYGMPVKQALVRVWAIMGFPAGKRLAPFMGELVLALERHGEITLSSDVRELLLAMSAATIDRLLAADRKRLEIKGRSGTRPGSLMKHGIPIRTFADWDNARPGFLEIDLVSHEGSNPNGEFCQTLDMTDVATAWTETVAVRNKAQRWVFAALKEKLAQFPFPILGLDSDNGSEFINYQLLQYCKERELTFTRSRPERKNDNCYVEQKNWAVVRKAVGYRRYDSPSQLALLNELYTNLRLYTNFFQPTQKLLRKERHGAKVRRRYDTAKTPYQRVLASDQVSTSSKDELAALFLSLNPAALQREINRLQNALIEPAVDQPFSTPPATKPRRNFSIRPSASPRA
jgi:hypothetical protein